MRTTPVEECRHWLGVNPGEEPQALIFTGHLDGRIALDAATKFAGAGTTR